MPEFNNLENVKGLLSLLDHYSLSNQLFSDPDALELPQSREKISQGFTPTAKYLLHTINHYPDKFKVIRAFKIKVEGDELKASHLYEYILNQPGSRSDLKSALKKINSLKLTSSEFKAALTDLLKILDCLDNERSLAAGQRLGAAATKSFNEQGLRPTINQLFRNLSAQDKKELAKIFKVSENQLTPLKLAAAALPNPADDTDLQMALCRVDNSTCNAAQRRILAKEPKLSEVEVAPPSRYAGLAEKPSGEFSGNIVKVSELGSFKIADVNSGGKTAARPAERKVVLTSNPNRIEPAASQASDKAALPEASAYKLRNKLADCFNRELKRNPYFQPKFILSLRTNNNGRPTSVSLRPKVGSDEFQTCVIDVSKKQTFPIYNKTTELPVILKQAL